MIKSLLRRMAGNNKAYDPAMDERDSPGADVRNPFDGDWLDAHKRAQGEATRHGWNIRVEPTDTPKHAFEHGIRHSDACGLSDNPYVVINCFDLADTWEEGRQLGIAIREGRV